MNLDKDYIGRVIFNEDPTFSGRCKIRVFGLFDELDEQFIPWFAPKNFKIFSSAKGAGDISVPKVGSIVRVEFESDIYSGEYTNIQNIDPALIDEIKSDYQNTHVLCYDSEKELMVMYQPMTGFKIYLAGSLIKVDSDGSIQLKHRNNSNVVEVNNGDINITTVGEGSNTNGVINISAGSTVNLTAPTVNIDSKSISLGKYSVAKAVKGDKLCSLLKQFATEINTKFPQGASTLVGRSFEEILSDTVTLN